MKAKLKNTETFLNMFAVLRWRHVKFSLKCPDKAFCISISNQFCDMADSMISVFQKMSGLADFCLGNQIGKGKSRLLPDQL